VSPRHPGAADRYRPLRRTLAKPKHAKVDRFAAIVAKAQAAVTLADLVSLKPDIAAVYSIWGRQNRARTRKPRPGRDEWDGLRLTAYEKVVKLLEMISVAESMEPSLPLAETAYPEGHGTFRDVLTRLLELTRHQA